MSVGYIAWSWSGNSEKAKNLDLVLEFDPERLSPWGQRLIEGADGLRATSVPATVFQ
jgi:mannan endo-1,4-beta-mannosidase